MKYCTKCGKPIDDDAVFCPNCGESVGSGANANVNNGASQQSAPYKPSGLSVAARVLMIIEICGLAFLAILCFAGGGCVTTLVKSFGDEYRAFASLSGGAVALYGVTFLIPLLWIIPMTVSYSKKKKNGQPVSTGFKVCTLIFVNMLAGILMLCDNSDNY